MTVLLDLSRAAQGANPLRRIPGDSEISHPIAIIAAVLGLVVSRSQGENSRITRKTIIHCVGGSVLMMLCLSSLQMPALSHDLDVTALIPLHRVKPYYLDKAKGIGPRFEFGFTPTGITPSCAKSIKANVNDADFVEFVGGARTSEEFRARADTGLLTPSEAGQMPVHESYALRGQGQISGAICTNLSPGATGRGFCTATISGSGYMVVYDFDPVACRYDNMAVANILERHLLIAVNKSTDQGADCATKLKEFVTDVDCVLAGNPHDIFSVYDVLDRHFPLHGCAIDVASGIIKESKYFRSIGMNGRTHVFALSSETSDRRGVVVSFGLTETGESYLPFSMWSPPFP
jgi:hypothetical protein